MKSCLAFLSLIFLLGCSQKQDLNLSENPAAQNEYFSLTEFNQNLDSLKQIWEKEGLEPELRRKGINPDYDLGKIHFVIVDNRKSYYALNSNYPFLLFDNENTVKEDSNVFVSENIKTIQKLQPIFTDSITRSLTKYKPEISESSTISFALQKDTVGGNIMFKILNYMENNGLKRYTIRKTNPEEQMLIGEVDRLFSLYSVPIIKSKLVEPRFDKSLYKNDLEYVNFIEEGVGRLNEINFAGKYTIISKSCGLGCISVFIINRETGEVLENLPKEINGENQGVLFRKESKLMILNPDSDSNKMYFIIENDNMREINLTNSDFS